VERAVGAGNFNELASGYVGLATLAVLVPIGWQERGRRWWVRVVIVLELVALAAAYRLPPVDNAIRLVPVLSLLRPSRWLLLITFSHVLLASAGLDRLVRAERVAMPLPLRSQAVVLVGIGILFAAGALAWWAARGRLQEEARAWYRRQALARGLEPDALRDRADRMTERAVRFFPRYYGMVAGYAMLLAALVELLRRGLSGGPQPSRAGFCVGPRAAATLLACASIADLFCCGQGYNPAIPAERYFPRCGALDFLSSRPGPFRVLPMDEEFPPNLLAAYGLADVRNYDAIELRSHIELFYPLWADSPDQLETSCAWSDWRRIERCLPLLEAANVAYLVHRTGKSGAVAGGVGARGAARRDGPPPSIADQVRAVYCDRGVTVYRVHGARPVSMLRPGDKSGVRVTGTSAAAGVRVSSLAALRALKPAPVRGLRYEPGRIELVVQLDRGAASIVLPESYAPGWHCVVDGRPAPVWPFCGSFLCVRVAGGQHHLVLEYWPLSVTVGLAASAVSAAVWLALLLAAAGFGRRHMRFWPMLLWVS